MSLRNGKRAFARISCLIVLMAAVLALSSAAFASSVSYTNA